MRNNEEHEVSIVKIQKNFDITHLLPEEAVNLAVIVNIFNNASMNVSDIHDDRFTVHGNGDLGGFTCILKFKKIFFVKNITLESIDVNLTDNIKKNINNANQHPHVAFYLRFQNDIPYLSVRHDLTYENGIIANHIISQAALFENRVYDTVVDILRSRILKET